MDMKYTKIAIGSILGVIGLKLAYDCWIATTHKRKLLIKSIKSSALNNSLRTVEICICDIESARHAVNGGANSLELCSNRMEGGTTPSIGFIEECVKLCRSFDVEVHVLIRPRAGDFVYTVEEFEVMERDIMAAKMSGADGVVCGILTNNGDIDKLRMAIVRELTRGMKLTFHRAFDLCPHYENAIQDIIQLGCDRLLTSGQEKFAVQGARSGKLRKIVTKCNQKVKVIAAAGINFDNVREIIELSHVGAVHIGNGVNTTTLSSLSLDPTLETPLFTMAAEMTVWKCTQKGLVKTVANKAWQSWESIDTDLAEKMGNLTKELF